MLTEKLGVVANRMMDRVDAYNEKHGPQPVPFEASLYSLADLGRPSSNAGLFTLRPQGSKENLAKLGPPVAKTEDLYEPNLLKRLVVGEQPMAPEDRIRNRTLTAMTELDGKVRIQHGTRYLTADEVGSLINVLKADAAKRGIADPANSSERVESPAANVAAYRLFAWLEAARSGKTQFQTRAGPVDTLEDAKVRDGRNDEAAHAVAMADLARVANLYP